jgi:hypothetical protein
MFRILAVVVACAMLTLPHLSTAKATTGIPPEITTPDRVQTRIGALEFKDGVPNVETAQKVYDTLDFTRGLNVFNNSFRGASAYAIHQGFLDRDKNPFDGAKTYKVTLPPDIPAGKF